MKYFIIILFSSFYFKLYAQSCNSNQREYFIYEDVKAILDQNQCNSCHKSGSQLSSWHYESFESLVHSGSCIYPVVKFGDAAVSTLFQVLNGNSHVCFDAYQAEHKISNTQKEIIEQWINFGAPEKCVLLFDEMKNLLDQNLCNSCHNSTDNAGGWKYETYQDIILDNDINCAGSSNVKFFNAEESQLYLKLTDKNNNQCGSKMLVQGKAMGEDDMTKIRDWINATAPFNYQALPVVLEYFQLNEFDDQYIEVAWLSEVENNTDKYIIERSKSGFEFEVVGEVIANGNAGKYSFQDLAVKPGNNYYRLKILDKNGKYEYSAMRHSTVKSRELVFDLWPNPAKSKEKLMVEWYSKNSSQTSANIELIDLSGKKLAKYYIEIGFNELQLPELSTGIYMLVINDYFSTAHWERIIIFE